MVQQADESGQYMEAVSPLISPASTPAPRHVSAMSEMIENTPPIPVENNHIPSNDKKYQQDSFAYFSAPEAVDPYPPQYPYGGPPPGSPPPQFTAGYGGHEKGNYQQVANEAAEPQPKEEPKILGLRRKLFYIVLFALIALILLGVGLGAGLGIGLKKDKSNDESVVEPFCRDHPEFCVGGSLDAKYYSTKGAFNGSGIALAGESWNNNVYRLFTLYFQHHSGDIRYMQYTSDRKWVGGSSSETIASDAKNGSAISAVAYTMNSTSYNHIFYVSKDNKVHQRILKNDTNIWQEGPLNAMNLTVLDSPTVGLQACWKGNFYGDSDYKKFPTADGQENKVPFEDAKGINLWFGSDESTFQQYAWYSNAGDTWVKLSPWLGKNVHAGVGCYSWGAGSVTYTMMVNQNNATEIYWKDGNDTLKSTDTHRINEWTNSSAAIPNVYPATSLGYTNYLYMQMADRSIKGFNVHYEAEGTYIPGDDQFTIAPLGVADKALGGTHLTATAIAVKDPKSNGTVTLWDSLYVFVQTVGDDITAYGRPIKGGEWSKAQLSIPDE